MTTRTIKGTEVEFSQLSNADYISVVHKTLREKKSQEKSRICTC